MIVVESETYHNAEPSKIVVSIGVNQSLDMTPCIDSQGSKGSPKGVDWHITEGCMLHNILQALHIVGILMRKSGVKISSSGENLKLIMNPCLRERLAHC